uniref:Uncharacterized protein n=1 Tax=Tanacetum cinerariifolium TaxID=118510 RepID=A0A699JPB9_TANCI|nr:hypothetical protein [Tanacetum cinerariifolium]
MFSLPERLKAGNTVFDMMKNDDTLVNIHRATPKSYRSSKSTLESFFWTSRSSISSISHRLSLGKSPSLNL